MALVCSSDFDFVTGRTIVMDGGRTLPRFPASASPQLKAALRGSDRPTTCCLVIWRASASHCLRYRAGRRLPTRRRGWAGPRRRAAERRLSC